MNKEPYFLIERGYESDPLSIGIEEVERAMYAHMTGKVVNLSCGSVSGKFISAVTPDFRRTMGWNYGYKMQPADWDEVRSIGLDNEMRDMLAEAKECVSIAIKADRPDLLDKGLDVAQMLDHAQNRKLLT